MILGTPCVNIITIPLFPEATSKDDCKQIAKKMFNHSMNKVY